MLDPQNETHNPQNPQGHLFVKTHIFGEFIS